MTLLVLAGLTNKPFPKVQWMMQPRPARRRVPVVCTVGSALSLPVAVRRAPPGPAGSGRPRAQDLVPLASRWPLPVMPSTGPGALGQVKVTALAGSVHMASTRELSTNGIQPVH